MAQLLGMDTNELYLGIIIGLGAFALVQLLGGGKRK